MDAFTNAIILGLVLKSQKSTIYSSMFSDSDSRYFCTDFVVSVKTNFDSERTILILQLQTEIRKKWVYNLKQA